MQQHKITMVVRQDITGLGNQSYAWYRLLHPDKLIIIDLSSINNNVQHPERYASHDHKITINGFIKPHHIEYILSDTDVLLTFEIPYNYELISAARARGVKVILQNNWEFTDYLQNPSLPLPDLLVNHSYWNLDEQKRQWPGISEYCATPIFVEDYDSIYHLNQGRSVEKCRFLHIAGRATHLDRNGTEDLLAAMKLIPEEIDFELVIKTQTTDVGDISDSRITIDSNSPLDEKELYRNFDAMIMPRRYGGASLPMTEALAAGLPVIMTDIDPNNKILPSYWLVPAEKKTSFMARTNIDVYSADHTALAARIAQFAVADETLMRGYKELAHEIAIKEYSSEVIKEKWALLLAKIGV